ncbi:homoserine O-succinyltransferase [Enterobacteriaceae endosymbiont of Macroplea mutica]|uniref:homoserine O-succinyltransferase n=1 Tax=Enterobacteriaceae endosymbiont of Macroplea mutica TaxID=2675791 RepID=UPI001448FA0B|nr:homoserine O-succinyltransferase [Enterobacteriaceae endosymbiont of Macroplea mutica]QJC31249.1 homoserine O-succinyltransferase [Enterobacteriaceae endosymbiont of Macroplea mutica]
MPVIVPQHLPVIKNLSSKNLLIFSNMKNNILQKYSSCKIINIVLLNLMYDKINTENQIIKILSQSSSLIKLTLLNIDHIPSNNINTNMHIKNFYTTLNKIFDKYYDGLIITGAPLGLINFTDVRYWDEFIRVIYWSLDHVKSILSICWSVQAILYILYHIPKNTNYKKIIGIFKHQIANKNHYLIQGFDDYFFVPHSRYANFSINFIKKYKYFDILSYSEKAGVYIFTDYKYIFVTGHPEYDRYTLAKEYNDYIKKNIYIDIPYHYFINNDITSKPTNRWKSHGYLLFMNWIFNLIHI